MIPLCREMFSVISDFLLFDTVFDPSYPNFLSGEMIHPNVFGTSLPYTQVHLLSCTCISITRNKNINQVELTLREFNQIVFRV